VYLFLLHSLDLPQRLLNYCLRLLIYPALLLFQRTFPPLPLGKREILLLRDFPPQLFSIIHKPESRQTHNQIMIVLGFLVDEPTLDERECIRTGKVELRRLSACIELRDERYGVLPL
jgi:hypothetical protein